MGPRPVAADSHLEGTTQGLRPRHNPRSPQCLFPQKEKDNLFGFMKFEGRDGVLHGKYPNYSENGYNGFVLSIVFPYSSSQLNINCFSLHVRDIYAFYFRRCRVLVNPCQAKNIHSNKRIQTGETFIFYVYRDLPMLAINMCWMAVCVLRLWLKNRGPFKKYFLHKNSLPVSTLHRAEVSEKCVEHVTADVHHCDLPLTYRLGLRFS